jgi:hypothetical protein
MLASVVHRVNDWRRAMLWDISAIKGYAIEADDGQIGTVSDFLFEDDSWIIRWLVADTGDWFSGRKVLLPISALGQPSKALRQFPVKLSMQQVKDSPDIDTDRAVSRQLESEIYDYYGWNPYWSGGHFPVSGAIATPFVSPLYVSESLPRIHVETDAGANKSDLHLRSVAHITGYHIHATDGAIGHVEDFLVEDTGWSIRYVVLDTKNWWPGKKVLVAPDSVREIDASLRVMHLNVDRQTVKNSPEEDTVNTGDKRPDLREYRQRVDMDDSAMGARRTPPLVLVESAHHNHLIESTYSGPDIVSPRVGHLPLGQTTKE